MIHPDSCVTVPSNVLVRSLEDEAVILDLHSGTYFGLDDVGTRMWGLLAGGLSVRQVHERLAGEYAVDHAQLYRDLLTFIEQLHEHRLIHVG